MVSCQAHGSTNRADKEFKQNKISYNNRHVHILELLKGRFVWLVSPERPPWLALSTQKIFFHVSRCKENVFKMVKLTQKGRAKVQIVVSEV